MSNRIASIGKMMMNQGSGIDIVKRQEEAAEVMFADMISMNYSAEVDYSGAETTDEALRTVKTEKFDARKEKLEDTYEKYQYKDKTIRRETDDNTTVKVEEAATEVKDFEEAVTEVISEELHVSKEELEAVMEELGLTYLDLLDNSNLGLLATKLTGCENMGQLLCNEGFMNVLKEVKLLGGELLNELQMTPEEFVEFQKVFEQAVVGTVKETVTSDDVKVLENVISEDDVAAVEDVKETVTMDTVEKLAVTETMDETVVVENQQETEQDIEEVLGNLKDFNAAKETVIDEAVTEEDTKIQVVGKTEDMDTSEESMSEEEGQQEFTNNQKLNTVQMPQTNEHVVVKDVETMTFANQLGEFETVQTLPPQVTVADIMEQFAEHTRVLLSADTTRMEMQLNPEHLGKLYLEVVESEGVITAKLQTQSIEVKEALETQIADLKVNLNQAGVKVDSVEVTIASHEFERNLEQDANSRKQQEEAYNQIAGHRNINLNELDELSGLMSEEEVLVAKMMAEQGNSVDFSA